MCRLPNLSAATCLIEIDVHFFHTMDLASRGTSQDQSRASSRSEDPTDSGPSDLALAAERPAHSSSRDQLIRRGLQSMSSDSFNCPGVNGSSENNEDDNNNNSMQEDNQELDMEVDEDGASDEDLDDEDEDEDDDLDRDEAMTTEPPAPVEEDAAIARRRAIQEIMRNPNMTSEEKSRAIQNLMSGGRTHVTPPPPPVVPVPEANAACVHYERNCNIVAPCCDRVFGCRICHDELSPTGHGPMNRFLIREVVCKNCNTRQPASNQCNTCQTVFGEYHCNICNLWMSMSKKPFHCAQCGFCRVGGIEAFRHCSECCMCISVSVFNTHQCFRDKYKNNCPVCREDMFSSRQSPQDLPCGHAIHAHCFRKLAGFDYRCPICKKTVVSQQSMAAAWEARARDIAEHPMPSDLQRIVDIMCNDCETKSSNRDWHFLGIQCPRCNSFNTVVEQVVSAGPPPGQSGNATSGSA